MDSDSTLAEHFNVTCREGSERLTSMGLGGRFPARPAGSKPQTPALPASTVSPQPGKRLQALVSARGELPTCKPVRVSDQG